MSLICPHCGAENRESAKFCLKCAQQLVELSPATVMLPEREERSRRRRRRRSSAPASHSRSAWLWATLLSLALLSLGGLIWRWGVQHGAALRQAQVTQAARTAAPTITSAPAVPAASAPLPPIPAAVSTAPLTLSEEALKRADGEHTAPPTRAASAAAHGSATRRAAPSKRSPLPEAPAPAPAPVIEATPPAPPAPAPAAEARPAPPRELCAGTRFLARGLCLQTECDKPGQRQHPQCVRMREQQEAIRQGSGGG